MSTNEKEVKQKLFSVEQLKAARQELQVDIAKRLCDFETMSGMTIDDFEIHREGNFGSRQDRICRVEITVKL